MKISTNALAEVEQALEGYINEVEASPLQLATKYTSILVASCAG